MLHRQVYPLLLAHACDAEEIRGRTRFQKMVFLMEQKIKSEGGGGAAGGTPMPSLGFVPFDYGPYSKTLQLDVDMLVRENLLKEEKTPPNSEGKVMYTYTITEEGKRVAKRLVSDPKYKKYRFKEAHAELDKIKKEFNNMGLPVLLRRVYGDYPDYASLSKYELW